MIGLISGISPRLSGETTQMETAREGRAGWRRPYMRWLVGLLCLVSVWVTLYVNIVKLWGAPVVVVKSTVDPFSTWGRIRNLAAMEAGDDQEPLAVVVTTGSSQNLGDVLKLIGSVHVWLANSTPIIVYDTGLVDQDIQTLRRLCNTRVILNKHLPTSQEDASGLQPLVMQRVLRNLPANSVLLYMEHGQVFRHHPSDVLSLATSHGCVLIRSSPNSEVLDSGIIGGWMGCSSKHPETATFVNTWASTVIEHCQSIAVDDTNCKHGVLDVAMSSYAESTGKALHTVEVSPPQDVLDETLGNWSSPEPYMELRKFCREDGNSTSLVDTSLPFHVMIDQRTAAMPRGEFSCPIDDDSGNNVTAQVIQCTIEVGNAVRGKASVFGHRYAGRFLGHRVPVEGIRNTKRDYANSVVGYYSTESDPRFPQQRLEWFQRWFDVFGSYHLNVSTGATPSWTSNYVVPVSNILSGVKSNWVPLNERHVTPVVYLQSNCLSTTNGRDDYVQELMKHVAVDSFGPCLNNADADEMFPECRCNSENSTKSSLISCQRYHQKPCIIKRYKFTLAFENSIDDDYVTEKFYQPLSRGSIPVYLGAPNIAQFSPAQEGDSPAHISVLDYASPKDLAEYLKSVAADDEALLSFFRWHDAPASQRVDSLVRPFLAGCTVCKEVHRQAVMKAIMGHDG